MIALRQLNTRAVRTVAVRSQAADGGLVEHRVAAVGARERNAEPPCALVVEVPLHRRLSVDELRI